MSSTSESSISTSKTRKWRVTILISGSGSNLAALMAALSSTLSNVEIVSVISNSKDAYGLIRASEHKPVPIPSSSYSPYNHQKAHPELYGPVEDKLKKLAAQEGSEAKAEWSRMKKELARMIKPEYQKELANKVRATKPDLIVLAGFMLILLPGTLETLVRDWDEGQEDNGEEAGVRAEGTLPTLGRSPYPSSTGPPKRGTPIPIINLHPALPGSFVGPRVIEDAWEAFNQRRIPGSSDDDQETQDKGLVEAMKATKINEGSADADAVLPSATNTTYPTASPTVASRFGPRITKTGIMIHRVIPELDRGEPVLHREIEMIEGETLAQLKERIHKVEHEAIVAAVKKVTEQLENGSWWDEPEPVTGSRKEERVLV